MDFARTFSIVTLIAIHISWKSAPCGKTIWLSPFANVASPFPVKGFAVVMLRFVVRRQENVRLVDVINSKLCSDLQINLSVRSVTEPTVTDLAVIFPSFQ